MTRFASPVASPAGLEPRNLGAKQRDALLGKQRDASPGYTENECFWYSPRGSSRPAPMLGAWRRSSGGFSVQPACREAPPGADHPRGAGAKALVAGPTGENFDFLGGGGSTRSSDWGDGPKNGYFGGSGGGNTFDRAVK